jgi:type VI secretion system protein ImpF
MAELTTGERLQPSLLDRLTDDEPKKSKESRDKRVMSLQQIREAVERDLASLLSAGCLETTEDLDGYPEVQRSVLNYGIPDLAGATVTDADTEGIERMLHRAISDFEPRILADSLRVRVITNPDEMRRRAVVFEIEGKIWSQPMPLRLFWNTEVDLETGDVKVKEGSR